MARAEKGQGAGGRPPSNISLLLAASRRGHPDAIKKAIDAAYDDLRLMAARLFLYERRDHTLQPTALVHEAYSKLIATGPSGFKSPAHFFGAAKRAMMQVLVDYSRSRATQKRFHHQTDAKSAIACPYETIENQFEINDVLKPLADVDQTWAALCRLRIIEGYTAKEAAAAVGLGESTARREFSRARQWLRAALFPVLTGSWIGKTFSHYKVLRKLGAGATATTYLAKDVSSGQFVAIKLLEATGARHWEITRRFAQEACCVSLARHPNIVKFHEIGRVNGQDFIVMEYIQGRSLSRAIPKNGFPVPAAVAYALQIAEALAEVHSAGIVHRDLKPSNVRLSNDGMVKLLDFGLASSVYRRGSDRGHREAITQPGTIMGTVGYMSPEQVLGRTADFRADIFSFGAVLYELLSGKRAFQAESPVATMTAILHHKPPALPRTVPQALARVVSRCLQKKPGQRYQSMVAVKADLQRDSRRAG